MAIRWEMELRQQSLILFTLEMTGALRMQISKGVVCISRIFYSAFIFIHFWALVLLILFRSVMLMSNFLDFMKDDVVAVDKIQNNKISSEMKSSVPQAGIIGLDV